MGKKDNLVAGIMTTLIILIFLLTTYFCLYIFGIIEVPDNLSLVSLINAKTEKVIAVNPIEDLIITEENIDDWINANTKSDVDEEDKEPGCSGTGHGDGLLPHGRDRRRLRRG